MASPLQTPSARRKLAYFGLILGVFVVNTFFWRGVSSPLTGGKPPAWTVTANSADLELTEESTGEADLLGSTVRLGLTGSRGLATTILWNAAIDKQMKHEWNELEFIVRSLTKLQPHFLTPWLFQSWNLTYNVSVESDRVRDKYFYITRGIELLAQGERLNRDNPDMRYWLGFYFQNKFGVADEANSLRSLFQLSCIQPDKRNPDDLAPKDRTGKRAVDMAKFEQFCRDHPQLVRRLREPPRELTRAFRCNTPLEVVEFLADSRRIPTRFVDPDLDAGPGRGNPGDLKPAGQQFPTLPTARPERFQPADVQPTASDTLDDRFDAYQAARAWFAYAQDPLPDLEPMTDLVDRKDRIKQLKGRRRLPRQPAEVIFRQSPSRAQSYVAERLQKEGWFDDSGWTIDAGRSGLNRWFPPGHDVTVGAGQDLATDAWEMAFSMWRTFGVLSGMLFESGAQEQNAEALAAKFRERYNIPPFDMAMGFRPEDMPPDMAESLLAHRRLYFRLQNLQMTNFLHHYNKANAERDKDTAKARKTINQAERLRADPDQAMEAFEKGFAQWRAVLLRYPDFRADESTQEELYESEIHYLDLVRDHRGDQLRPFLAIQGVTAEVAAGLGGGVSPAQAATGLIYRMVTDAQALPLPVLGPLDVPDATGKPFILPEVAKGVRTRLGLDAPPPAPKEPPAAPIARPAPGQAPGS